MEIRKTQLEDIDVLMKIYDRARRFMQETGNGNQWIDGYPSSEIVMRDMTNQNSYVCIDEDNEIVATFFFMKGEILLTPG